MSFYILLTTFYVLFAFLAWRRLPWAVLLVIATLPSYLIRFHVGPIPMTALEGMVLVVFAVWAIRKFSIFKFQFTVNDALSNANSLEIGNWKLRIPLLLFLASATVAMFIAPDLRAAAGIWKAYFIEPILFFLVLRDLLSRNVILNGAQHSEESLTAQSIIYALSLTALLLSLYAIYQRFTGFGIPPPWDTELRVTSIFTYPNALALFLAPLVPLMIVNLKYEKQKVKFYILHFTFYIIAITSSVIAIVFAQSTGALIGVTAGLIVMGLLVLRGKAHDRELFHAKRFYARITIAVLAALAAFTILAPPSLKNELLLRNWSGHVRRVQWTETIEMLKDRPILGAGLAGYKETLAPYHKATYLEIFEYPHNIVLNFWSETGLLGLLAFAWIVVVFFRTTIIPPLKIRGGRGSYESITLGATAAMVTILVHGLVDVPYFKNDLSLLFWIIYALGINTEAHSLQKN